MTQPGRRVILIEERTIIARLLLDLLGSANHHYFNGLGLAASTEATIIVLCVFRAQQDREPATISSLSRCTGLSRMTVQRRLKTLVAKQYLARHGAHYTTGTKLVRPPGGERGVKNRAAIIKKAARALLKLSK